MIGLEGAQSAHANGMWGRVQGGVRPLLPRGYDHRKFFKITHRKSCSFMHSALQKYGLLTYYSGRNRLPCDCSYNHVHGRKSRGDGGTSPPRICSGGTLIQVASQIFVIFQNFKRSPWIRPPRFQPRSTPLIMWA
jgi:hypothetical protein